MGAWPIKYSEVIFVPRVWANVKRSGTEGTEGNGELAGNFRRTRQFLSFLRSFSSLETDEELPPRYTR